MRVKIPHAPHFYPPVKGDWWGSGRVIGYERNVDGTYRVQVQYADGLATFDRCPVAAGQGSIGRIEWNKRA